MCESAFTQGALGRKAAGISFPTVECLTQDIITCGNVRGKSCVFYSMGAKGIDASNYAQQGLNGRGVTFHMALDRDYIFRVLRNPKFRITDPTRNADNLNRQDIHVRKLSQAFASVCEGDAFLMILKRNGHGGGVGLYQTPWVKDSIPFSERKDNVWENDEFPSLQLNDKLPRVFSVDMSNGNAPHVDWTRGQDQQTRLPRNVEAIPLPS